MKKPTYPEMWTAISGCVFNERNPEAVPSVSATDKGDTLPKLEERKRFLLETILRLGRPIWAGDVARNAVEQELYRLVFHALAEEGEIVRRGGGEGQPSV